MANVQQLIIEEAARQGVSPSLALAVAQRESGFNQSARGSSGEIGVFQLMPTTAADLGVNPASLKENIRGGVTYLRQMIGRYGVERGLQAYNGGPGNVERGTVSSAAQGYANAILAKLGVPTFSVTRTERLEPDPNYLPSGPVVAWDPGFIPPPTEGLTWPLVALAGGLVGVFLLAS